MVIFYNYGVYWTNTEKWSIFDSLITSGLSTAPLINKLSYNSKHKLYITQFIGKINLIYNNHYSFAHGDDISGDTYQ